MSDWSLRYHVPRSQVWEGSRGGQAGVVHMTAERAMQVGRVTVPAGRALCKKPVGWYEREPYGDERCCPRCEERAERHGIEWPAAPSSGQPAGDTHA